MTHTKIPVSLNEMVSVTNRDPKWHIPVRPSIHSPPPREKMAHSVTQHMVETETETQDA